MTASESPPFASVEFPPRDERVALERKISLKFKEFRGFVTEFSDNLSLGGMFIRTTTPAPIGTVFDFEFALDEGEALVHGIGQVIWVRDRDQGFDLPAGIGVRFLFVDPDGRQLIERLVADRLAGGAPITEYELGPGPVTSIPLPTAQLGAEAEATTFGEAPFGEAPSPPESPPRPAEQLSWQLDTPPLNPPNPPSPMNPAPGLLEPPAVMGPPPSRARTRGGATGAERPRRRLVPLLAVILGFAVLVALGWYAATLVGLVGSTEPEKVTLRAIPVPGPADEAPAPAEASTGSAPSEPPVQAEPAVQTEPAVQAESAVPDTVGQADPAVEPAATEPVAPDPAPDAAVEGAVRPGERRGGRGRGDRHFTSIVSIRWEERPDGIDVILTADGKVEEWDYTLIHLNDPPRELVKIENVERGFTATTLEVGSRDLPRIRVGFHRTPAGNELHVVLDLATPSVRVEHGNAEGKEIRLKLTGPR